MADGSSNPRTLADLLLRGGGRGDKPDPARRPGSGGRVQMDLLFGAGAVVVEPAPPDASAAGTEPARELRPAAPLIFEDPIREEVAPPAERVQPTAPAADDRRRIWTVAALVANVRQRLEAGYQDVLVAGEVSNCRTAASGHLYFTLRDGDAQISAVLFRRQAQLLRFTVRDGLEVLARGRLSMFEPRGQLQLIAETLEPRGTGSLQLAFEQLKAKLMAEGLFDAERKRTLPAFPQRVGVVTSIRGAVVHDIIKVIRRRHACLDLLIFPATVQGPECPGTVAAGIRWFNRAAGGPEAFRVDLILVARGGGSLEDVAGFNDEALARAIAASELPVVSAVGHETDFTIADFVADLRAPTPSAAAEMITAAQHRIGERVGSLDTRLERAIRYQTIMARQRFTALSADQILARVRQGINRRGQRVDDLERRLESATARKLQALEVETTGLAHRLERRHPGESLREWRRRLGLAEAALGHLVRTRLQAAGSRLQSAEAGLAALSPYAVLRRGYALVYADDGTVLREAAQAGPGTAIRARLARGSLTAQVTAVEAETPKDTA